MVKGRVGSPPYAHTHSYILNNKLPNPATGLVVNCMEPSPLCLGFKGEHISAADAEEGSPQQDQGSGRGDDRGEARWMRLVTVRC